ncbi:MAG: DUF2490 domain-containing protein [Flavobacteriales bacterium]
MKKLLLPILLYSQFTTAQTGLWLDAGVTKKWNKSFKTSFEIGERRNLGVGFDRLYLDVGPSYQIFDGVQLTGAYRLVSNEKGDRFVLQASRLSQRFQVGAEISILDAFDFGPKRLELSWSSIQQWSIQTGKQTSSIWRNKLSLSYDIKNFPLSPQISAEHFYQWNESVVYTPTEVIVTGATVQWRYFIGFGIELPQKQSLKILFGIRERSSGIQPLLRASYGIQI